MILPFSTQINGKQTYFVQKIWASLKHKYLLKQFVELTPLNAVATFEISKSLKPKIHTIREDKSNRWKPGTMIDFFINTRKKDMFRFAPRVPVMSLQYIEFKEIDTENYIILVDGKVLTINKIKELAQNDGFDNVKDFLNYFPTDFKGKIIHWTTLKY